MKPQEINISHIETAYDITFEYHSDLMCQNYDAKITAIEGSDGRITFRPINYDGWCNAFVFEHSDPDRVLAIANMMKAFAEMVKQENKKSIDLSSNE